MNFLFLMFSYNVFALNVKKKKQKPKQSIFIDCSLIMQFIFRIGSIDLHYLFQKQWCSIALT